MRYYKYYLVACFIFLAGGCIEPYRPEIIQGPHNYLVVDGFINSNGITTIRLSRTVNLDGATIPPGETKARVLIEEEGGRQFVLTEGRDGNYTSQPLQLNNTRLHRLHIRTADNKEFASDYVKNKITPPIDSVSWKAESDALHMYVSTRDPQQNTRYYRWKYEETWEFNTPFFSYIEFKNNQLLERKEFIYRCWRENNSSVIQVASTAKLSQDVVSQFPLIRIPANSVKLKYAYSVLVKQYAQTREAYEYAETLKKNTENIGTLFDPLPSQLTGNIRCLSNPQEPVIGFMIMSTVQEKRVFIKRIQLPDNWRETNEFAFCELDTVLVKDALTAFRTGPLMPVGEIRTPFGTITGYTGSSSSCVDCRLSGTNVKPAFWE